MYVKVWLGVKEKREEKKGKKNNCGRYVFLRQQLWLARFQQVRTRAARAAVQGQGIGSWRSPNTAGRQAAC